MSAKSKSVEPFVDLIANHLKGLDFRKERLSWRRTTPETIAFFGLQKSRMADWYYFNIGMCVPELDPKTRKPKAEDLHVWERLESLANISCDPGMPLNLEDPELIPMQLTLFEHALTKTAVPILLEFGTVSGVKAVLRKYPNFAVKWKMPEFLKASRS
jgi:Domain of unknown function (DUF4304)